MGTTSRKCLRRRWCKRRKLTRWLAPTFASIHAIEPNPEALDELRQDLPHNVTVHAVGAWSCSGDLTFTRFAHSVHLTAYFQHEGINTGPKLGEITLSCQALDEMGIQAPVTLLKCDTEGAEVECLRGAQKLITRDRPWLLIECHSNENFWELSDILRRLDYNFTVVRHPHYKPFSDLWYSHCWLSCQPQLAN